MPRETKQYRERGEKNQDNWHPNAVRGIFAAMETEYQAPNDRICRQVFTFSRCEAGGQRCQPINPGGRIRTCVPRVYSPVPSRSATPGNNNYPLHLYKFSAPLLSLEDAVDELFHLTFHFSQIPSLEVKVEPRPAVKEAVVRETLCSQQVPREGFVLLCALQMLSEFFGCCYPARHHLHPRGGGGVDISVVVDADKNGVQVPFDNYAEPICILDIEG